MEIENESQIQNAERADNMNIASNFYEDINTLIKRRSEQLKTRDYFVDQLKITNSIQGI